MANPYDTMKRDLIEEAESGLFDEDDEIALSVFSNGESDKVILEDDDDDDEDIYED